MNESQVEEVKEIDQFEKCLEARKLVGGGVLQGLAARGYVDGGSPFGRRMPEAKRFQASWLIA
jgi:hypothetical protein